MISRWRRNPTSRGNNARRASLRHVQFSGGDRRAGRLRGILRFCEILQSARNGCRESLRRGVHVSGGILAAGGDR